MSMTYFAQPPMARDQDLMFHPTLDELICPDHDVRTLDELVNACDFTAWEATYHGSRGQPPFPPKALAKIWLYAKSMRISSSRRVEYALRHNLDFIWLAQGYQIDHVTLAKFRTRFKRELKGLFRQVVKIAMALGLVRLNEITFDGTRVKSNNARDETLTAAGCEKRLAELELEMDEFLKQSAQQDAIENQKALETLDQPPPVDPKLVDMQERKKQIQEALEQVRKMDQERKQNGKDTTKNPAQIPETDPDSRVMPNKEGGFAPNFTPVTAVDTQMGFIVYATVLQDVNEHTHAQTVVTTIQADFGIRPARMLTDGLNSTGQNLAAFENSGTELISPLAEAAPAGPNPAVRADPTQPVPEAEWPLLPRNPQKQLDKSCFQYDAEKDVYYCPQGKTLHYEETKPKVLAGDQKLDVRIYRSAECEGCPLAKACLSAKNVHGRTVSRDEYTEHRERHAARMERPEAKEAYKRRLHAGETPFAHIKHVFGLRQFLLRGLEKVETEWLWACTTYNLMKLIRYLSKQRRESAQQVAVEAV